MNKIFGKYTAIIFMMILILTLIHSNVAGQDLNQKINEEDLFEEDKESREQIILEQIDQLNINELQTKIEQINQLRENDIPEINIIDIIFDLARGNINFEWRSLGSLIIRYFGREISLQLEVLGKIIILAVMSAILKIFHDSFKSESISKTVELLIFLVLAVLLLNSFQEAIEIVLNTLESIETFINSLIPILISLLVSLGAVTSASIFQPVTFLLISSLTTGIRNIIMPMILISMVLTIVNNISDEFDISRLAGLFKEYSMALLSFGFSILFSGILLQGGFAAISDSLTLRTAKFLSGRFIPVVGGIFSSALGLIVNSVLLIKNGLNLVGVLVIILIIIYPLAKILAMVVIYKLAAAILQPVCDTKLVNILNILGNNLIILFGILIGVALMFFIVITMIVGVANLTVMMR